jgi:hypothetical protein
MVDKLPWIILIVIFGGLSAWSQKRSQGQFAKLPPAAQKRLRIGLPIILGSALILTFIAIYFLRPHA